MLKGRVIPGADRESLAARGRGLPYPLQPHARSSHTQQSPGHPALSIATNCFPPHKKNAPSLLDKSAHGNTYCYLPTNRPPVLAPSHATQPHPTPHNPIPRHIAPFRIIQPHTAGCHVTQPHPERGPRPTQPQTLPSSRQLCCLSGRGPASKMRLLQYGLRASVAAELELQEWGTICNVWALKQRLGDATHRYIVVALENQTLYFAVDGEDVQQIQHLGAPDVKSLAWATLTNGCLVQVLLCSCTRGDLREPFRFVLSFFSPARTVTAIEPRTAVGKPPTAEWGRWLSG